MNTTDLTELPARPDISQYRKQAKELLASFKSQEPRALERVRGFHPHPSKLDGHEAAFKLSDAQAVIAREHGFLSWPKFGEFVEQVKRANSPVSEFEQAAEAVIAGDADKLRRLVAANPGLIRQRSARVHRCMLIHYVGSNGLENYRQKCPPNALEILKILLDAGAEVDAPADTYGRGTTLGLVATSVHPVIAGVQMELMQTLIDAGADVNGLPGSWTIVNACLANGRGPAAKLLAQRGARLDLEGAAGVGNLETVRHLLPKSEPRAVSRGFVWACEYGEVEVVRFLLDEDVPVDDDGGIGLSGLHMAVVGAQSEVAKLLIDRGASLENRSRYGGTPLGQAVWSSQNDQTGIDYRPVIKTLIEAGASGAGMEEAVEVALQREPRLGR